MKDCFICQANTLPSDGKPPEGICDRHKEELTRIRKDASKWHLTEPRYYPIDKTKQPEC